MVSVRGKIICQDNEIPSSHDLYMWKDHRYYGYTINCTFHGKRLLKWSGLEFHWCLHNNALHGCLEIRNFFSHVEKYFTRSLHPLVKYHWQLKERFHISTPPCNNSSIYTTVINSYSVKKKMLKLLCTGSPEVNGKGVQRSIIADQEFISSTPPPP